MWYYKEEIIRTPRAMTIGDLQYNKEVFHDPEKLKELGIKPYRKVMPDPRYWYSANLSIDTSGDEVIGTYTPVGKDTDVLVQDMLDEIKRQLTSKLEASDWYYLRKLRNGTDVPDDIQEYSDTLYAEYDTKKTEISAMTKMSHIMEYQNRPHTEVRKVKTYEKNKTIYGPKTTSSTRHINMCMHWTASPNDEVDPSLVSLTAD
jgi:hypothetical protein|tara:strand:+ start:174 stop:782 length:609 start_codon:yes stop_codon:yes gene_type:complete